MWQYISILVTFLTMVNCEYKYETKWFKVPLDHFGYQRNETFQIKYLENDEYWNRSSGPIFFYTGNEAQVELFAKHTGFMWDIASEFRAKLVFAEHRYYGKSLPFGNKSFDSHNIEYLTAAQAMADFADLINFSQGGSIRPRYPVITFGGSYGGMLAAYMRIKYPHFVNGAIASSTPLNMFPGMVPCDVFNNIVTSTFNMTSAECVSNIRQSWRVIRNFLTTFKGRDWLQKNWKLCHPIKDLMDLDILIDFLKYMYVTLSIVNYPYASDFWLPLPAHPVTIVCQYLNKTLTGQKLLEGIEKVLNTFTNYENKNKCVDYKVSNDHGSQLDVIAWDYQMCTEIVMPICATGGNDMFEPSPWSFSKFSKECFKKYNVYPREEFARTEYGGSRLQTASNIVFSNGLLDPWSGGGILNSASETVKAVILVDAAHHLDLMATNPADPDSVKIARNFHKKHINRWINEFVTQTKTEAEPTNKLN